MALSYEKQQKIFELLNKGTKTAAISEEVGVSRNTVTKYKKEWEEMKKKEKEKGVELAVEKKSTMALLSGGRAFNILDLARSESDLGELGAQAGMVVGGIADDFIEATDGTKPLNVRLAKFTRGALAGGSALLTGYETVRRVREERRLKERVKLSPIAQDELKAKILEIIKTRKEEMEIRALCSELMNVVGSVDRDRILAAIDELVNEGKLEVVR